MLLLDKFTSAGVSGRINRRSSVFFQKLFNFNRLDKRVEYIRIADGTPLSCGLVCACLTVSSCDYWKRPELTVAASLAYISNCRVHARLLRSRLLAEQAD